MKFDLQRRPRTDGKRRWLSTGFFNLTSLFSKRGQKIRGGIDGSASKGDNEDDADSLDEHDFDAEGKDGAEW